MQTASEAVPPAKRATKAQYKLVDPRTLLDSPTQPRKHMGDLVELIGSLKSLGMIEPIIVREVAKPGYGAALEVAALEVVAGHRRKHAAIAAELAEVPVLVKAYSDEEAIEAQLVENIERQSMHPLDEADGFKVWLGLGRSIAHIADRIGRDRSFVAQRLKLLDLTESGRKAFDAGKLTLGAAIVLARVPQNLQDEALAKLTEHLKYADIDEHSAVSEKYASEIILKHFILKLADAGWALDDADLVPSAGPCSTCVKRTGNQRELFSDIKSPALCTDPTCHRSKADALFSIRVKEARDAGQKVLEGKIAEDALSPYRSAYVRVDSKQFYDSETNKQVEVAPLVKKTSMPITLAQDQATGATVELVLRSDVTNALRSGGKKGAAAAASSSGKPTKGESYDQKQRREARRNKRLIELVMPEAVAAAMKGLKNAPLLTAIFRAFVQAVWHAEHHALLVRRNFEDLEKKEGAHNAVLALFDKGTPAEQLGIVAELVLLKQAPSTHSKPAWAPVLKVLGVKLDKLEEQVDAEEKARAKAQREKEQAAAKKAAAKAAGADGKAGKPAKVKGAGAAKGKLAAKVAAKKKAVRS
jgi:ParB/RepB/Spo0J family partition protein